MQLPAVRLSSTQGGAEEESRRDDHRPLDFSDTKEAFKSVSTRELWQHYLVFKIFSYEWLVDRSQEVRLEVLKFSGLD